MNGPTFVTGNKEKIRFVKLWLDYPFTHKDYDLPEIQSLDLHEVTADKLLRAYELLHEPVFIEDVSIVLPSLGRLPGPLGKWFLTDLGIDGILTLISSYDDRTAIASIEYGYHDGHECHYFAASVSGKISDKSLGSQKFGWNSIFIPEGQTKTYAQMNDDTLKKYSHRAMALKKLETHLKESS